MNTPFLPEHYAFLEEHFIFEVTPTINVRMIIRPPSPGNANPLSGMEEDTDHVERDYEMSRLHVSQSSLSDSGHLVSGETLYMSPPDINEELVILDCLQIVRSHGVSESTRAILANYLVNRYDNEY